MELKDQKVEHLKKVTQEVLDDSGHRELARQIHTVIARTGGLDLASDVIEWAFTTNQSVYFSQRKRRTISRARDFQKHFAMNSFNDKSGEKNVNTPSTSRSLRTMIPREIIDQEGEIESMYRHLVETSNTVRRDSGVSRSEVAVWACMVSLGVMNLIALWVFCLKNTGG